MNTSPVKEPQLLEPQSTLEERLRTGPGDWIALEDFAPLPQCLEWRLSCEFWNLRGPAVFFGGDVPYVAINDGRLSADAARLLVEICASSGPRSARVLEVGGGSGVFAKLFLDQLRLLAPALYEKTNYLWTDASNAMLEKAQADCLFADHAGKVQSQALPLPAMSALGAAANEGFDLIVANYLLDNLPATLLRISGHNLEELQVRASLQADLEPSRLGGCTAREWGIRAKRDPSRIAELVPLYPWFSLECRFIKVDRTAFRFNSMIPEPNNGAPLYWPHHEMAWTWLTECLPLLRPGGGVLVNDYGHFPLQGSNRFDVTQHFGGSLANGVNFDELNLLPRFDEQWLVAAPQTSSKQVHSRWIGRRADELSAGIFRLIFEGGRRDLVLDLLDQAQSRAESGRTEEARWLYWQAGHHSPRCWHVLERWAGFCLTKLRDFQTAHDLAVEGLKLNSRHPALWNLKGDALYEQKRFTEAADCFRRALQINPREIRARLNLAYVQLDMGRLTEALSLLAEALALDQDGAYRDLLLEKQRQVLLRISLDARDALAQQLNRFRNFEAPPRPVP